MAGRGPAPKAEDKRRRRNASPSTTALVSDGVLRGSPLPRSGWMVRVDGESVNLEWPEPTKGWWLNWRKSAQAQTFSPADWDFLLETAVLHARFWTGDHSVAGELRLRVAKFGATPEDRMRLKVKIETPGQPDQPAGQASATVTAITDRRKRLTG